MNIEDELVYGERIDELFLGLRACREAARIDDDGQAVFSVALEPPVGGALVRAMMRAEAELLLQDADAVGTPHHQDRTPDERSADAFFRLAEAVLGKGGSQRPRG